MTIANNFQSPQKWKKNRFRFRRRRPLIAPAGGFKVKKIRMPFRLPNFNFRPLIKPLLIFSIMAFLVGAIFVAALFAWTARDLPDPNRLVNRSVAQSTKIYDRTGQTILYDIHGQYQRTMIDLADFPAYVKWAFIATEDKEFYQHQGLSPKHIIKATALYGFQKIGLYRGLVPGGSTLTQQFVKNAILTKEKTIVRKLKEWIISSKIEKKFTKDEILKMYFNEIPFGSTAYGLEAASQTYFAKSAQTLTLGESAILAAMIKAPTYYSPFGNHTEELFQRQKFVLKEMAKENYVTEEEANAAQSEKIVFKQSLNNITAPHFVMYVRELLTEKYGEQSVEQDGYKIYTTLDVAKQKIAEEAINAWAERNQKDFDANNAALVSLDPKTGQILAMAGSKDYFRESEPAGCTPGLDCKFEPNTNVVLRPRQPGSSFKPIVYAAAFKNGYTPETLLFDVVTKFKTEIGKDYEPKNYDQTEHGPLTMRQALAGSLNIPAVKTIYLAGIDKVLDLADDLDYTTLKDRSRFGLSLVLGGGEVLPLEHASAFGVFATEGIKYAPMAILKVEDADGKILEEWQAEDQKGKRVLEPEIARQISSILSDNEARAFTFGGNNYLTLGNRPVAAKTGTTNDFRDGWTVGYTPSLATAVWTGNNDNTAMKGKADGSNIAAPIWRDYMQKALANSPVEYFNAPPPNMATKSVLKGELQNSAIIKIDKASGKLATDLTPPDYIQEIKFCEMHNILHYVDKDDPHGPAPEKPEKDGQYERWEEAVQRWAKETQQCQDQPDNLPTETDDLHIESNRPDLTIISPQNNETITTREYLVKIKASAPRGLKRAEYYIDDKKIKTVYGSFLDENYIHLEEANGNHALKVIIFDDIDNRREQTINFQLNTSEEIDFIQWINPVNNSVFNLSSSPLTLNIYFKNALPQKVSFYYLLNDQEKLITTINSPAINASTGWTPPGTGNYQLFIKTIEQNGSTKQSKKINLEVK
ncbi:MAG: penicillin-binding protein [bacterium]